MARSAVVVLGMHRSGTSAVAGLLVELGLTAPSDPLPPHPDNPKGYFEPLSAVQANEAMLAEARSSWFDLENVDAAMDDPETRRGWVERARASLRTSFGDADAIVLKEPRINRLWPIWRQALETEGFDIACVVVIRDPEETARSLNTRDGCSLAYGRALWLRHVAAAEAAARAHGRVTIDYGALLSEPVEVSRRLADLVASGAEVRSVARFIDPGLRREAVDADAAGDGPFAAVYEAGRALVERDDVANRERFDQAVAVAERTIDAAALARLEMLALWEDARLARKKARGWKRRAQKAEKALAAGEGSAAAADIYGAVPEAVVTRVRDSGLFDSDWYLSRYPDVAASGVDPIRHYLAVGAALGHDPGPLFETDLYVRQMAADEPKP
ncbi:sulfotransferase family protein [Brevundimonas lutea]|uniref:sulfotransferase family protein n=1 Tax=Brevundimonas lutea TaxID=2293980 RepID=UPI0013CF3405|nr:hypothetical protein [Brevundimonas lutea]